MNTQIIRPPARQRPSGYLYLNSVQTNLVDGTPEIVELDTVTSDFFDGIENILTHRITPGIAGYYSIVGNVRFEQLVGDKCYKAEIKVSGNTKDETIIYVGTGGVGKSIGARCVIPTLHFSATDYVELWATSFADVNTVDISSAINTFLSVQRVR